MADWLTPYAADFAAYRLNQSNATFGDRPGRRWSVRNYVKLSAPQD